MLAGYRRLLGEGHPDTARAHDMLASLHTLGHDDAAVEHGKKALEIYRAHAGRFQRGHRQVLQHVGTYLESLGDVEWPNRCTDAA